MPTVLVHGVPETPALWDPLRAHLRRDDVVALQLPGFGCQRPPGFGATKEEYVSWLVAELERLVADGPIDLVGHDWGGGFVVRLVSTRADLVRSWATDAAGLGDPLFEWHELAKVWQTPGAGEAFWPLPTAFLRGTAAAGGIALINAVGNLGGFVGPSLMGWMKDLSGSYAAGILLLATTAVVSGALVVTVRPAFLLTRAASGTPPCRSTPS